jgi:Flp pilus assembly protein TadD
VGRRPSRASAAIELNPNNALAHLQLGSLLIVGYGRADEGLKEVRAAAALDPLSPSVNTELGHALVLAGRYEEAAAQLRKAIGLDLCHQSAERQLIPSE